MRVVEGNIFCPDGQFRFGKIFISDNLIQKIEFDDSHEYKGDQDIKIIPGLCDIHFHGCLGMDISEANDSDLIEICEYEASNGVTSFCPTTMTYSFEKLIDVVNRVQKCKHAGIKGIHIEGPFVSAIKKGAQNEEFIRKPDNDFMDMLIEKSKGLIKIMTIAPETDDAIDLICKYSDSVIFSLGHTMADYDIAKKAFMAGASQVTHLYNAMRQFGHRDPGIITAALEDDNVLCEMICDGFHVDDAVIRNTFRFLRDDRIIMISDSITGCGMSDGHYMLGGLSVNINDKVAVLEDGTIAGGTHNLFECLKHTVKCGVDESKAIFSATRNPSVALGIYKDYGSIEEGKKADLLIIDNNYNLKEVIREG